MATLLEQVNIATDGNFVRQVQQALVKTALSVAGEADDTKNHAKRLVHANRVLLDPARWAQLAAYGVATSMDTGGKSEGAAIAISAKSADVDIEFLVNSQFDAYAIDGV
jgi:hypothetical protein